MAAAHSASRAAMSTGVQIQCCLAAPSRRPRGRARRRPLGRHRALAARPQGAGLRGQEEKRRSGSTGRNRPLAARPRRGLPTGAALGNRRRPPSRTGLTSGPFLRATRWLDKKGNALKPARAGRHVTDHTIAKELVALRAALKLAKRRGIWKGDPAEVLPVGFAPEYKPRNQFLTYDELEALLGELLEDAAARVAFTIATSAEAAATERALREDVSPDRLFVQVRGSKRATRWRKVPIVANWRASCSTSRLSTPGAATDASSAADQVRSDGGARLRAH